MAAHVVTGRIVFTYQPQGWPLGVLTGHPDGAGGFALEHVIVLPGAPVTTLLRMLHAGLEEAWRRHFDYVTFFLPHDLPIREPLEQVGTRMGFRVYETTNEADWYVRYRP